MIISYSFTTSALSFHYILLITHYLSLELIIFLYIVVGVVGVVVVIVAVDILHEAPSLFNYKYFM